MDKWSNKIAVITGGSSGMGAAISQRFTAQNITVINLDITVDEHNSVDDKVYNRKCDVSNVDSIKENFKWIDETFGKIHILVNCAGIAHNSQVINPSDKNTDLLNRTLDVNFKGSLHCTREAVQLMNKSNDHCLIVNLCSILGHSVPFSGFCLGVYHCTKHAIKALSEVIRQELILNSNDMIRVSNLSPGAVKTPMFTNAGLATSILGQLTFIEAEDVAECVMFLLSTPYHVNITELTVKPVGEKM